MTMLGNDSSVAEILALQDRNSNNDGFGGSNGAWWIIILILFFACGGWGRGFGYGGGDSGSGSGGIGENYVLASDMANISRQISDTYNSTERKLDGISNGLCDGFYAQNTNLLNGFAGIQSTLCQGFSGINTGLVQQGYETRLGLNGLTQQLADCCCTTQQNIKDVNYNVGTTGAAIQCAIKDCCCDTEKQFMQSRFDAAQYNCSTIQAIDKMGDRIIDYLANDKAQTLRDENQALRLAASQSAQNNYLISQLMPVAKPAYITCSPYASAFGYPFANGGCGGCNTCA